jgi:hypothetical protein
MAGQRFDHLYAKVQPFFVLTRQEAGTGMNNNNLTRIYLNYSIHGSKPVGG